MDFSSNFFLSYPSVSCNSHDHDDDDHNYVNYVNYVNLYNYYIIIVDNNRYNYDSLIRIMKINYRGSTVHSVQREGVL